MIFEVLDPDGSPPLTVSAAEWPSDDCWSLAHNAIGLAEAAVLFYVGIYPLEAPHFPWGKSLALPWRRRYPEGCRIAGEVAAIADLIVAQPEFGKNSWQTSGMIDGVWPLSERVSVQGLAVEVMIGADRTISALREDDYLSAALWLSSAYQNIIECTCEAQLILGIASENARGAAHALHAPNRQMRDQVFEWLDANRDRFKSDPLAVDAIMEARLNPLKRSTIETWITAWRKDRMGKAGKSGSLLH